MMNENGRIFMASFANTLSIGKGLLTRLIPSKAVAIRSATFPSWMMFTYPKFGLPFCHTSPAAKDFLAVKVTSGASNILATPRAFFSNLIRWSTSFVIAIVITVKRTVDSIKATEAIKSIPASWAHFRNCSHLALDSWHTYIIPHIEIEEKYCEIAANRCRQEVMELNL